MTIREFIKAAIEGGWKSFFPSGNKPMEVRMSSDVRIYLIDWDGVSTPQKIFAYEMFLDPEAWKAIFKEAIRMDMYEIVYEKERWGYRVMEKPLWYWHMQRMVQALAEGRTLEEYIATL